MLRSSERSECTTSSADPAAPDSCASRAGITSTSREFDARPAGRADARDTAAPASSLVGTATPVDAAAALEHGGAAVANVCRDDDEAEATAPGEDMRGTAAAARDTAAAARDETVTVAVPVVFTDEDESRGIKQGGVLNVTRHEIEIVVDAADIPAEITISLKGLEVGDSIHISDVKLPKGATPAIDDRDFAIATIVPPTVPTAADEAADAEAQAEGSEEA